MRIGLSTIIFSLLTAFVMNFAASQAWAIPDLESEAEIQKLGELDLEHEVETLESYGEAAGLAQERVEVAQLRSESKALEKKIAQLEKSNKKNRKRSLELARAYQQKDRLAQKVKARADKIEAEHNRLQAKNNALRARVERSESRVISEVDRQKKAEATLAFAKKENRELLARQRSAQNKLQATKKKIDRTRAQTKRIAVQNNNLKKSVSLSRR